MSLLLRFISLLCLDCVFVSHQHNVTLNWALASRGCRLLCFLCSLFSWSLLLDELWSQLLRRSCNQAPYTVLLKRHSNIMIFTVSSDLIICNSKSHCHFFFNGSLILLRHTLIACWSTAMKRWKCSFGGCLSRVAALLKKKLRKHYTTYTVPADMWQPCLE